MTHVTAGVVSLMWLGSLCPAAGQVQDPALGCPESDVVSYSPPAEEAMQDISIAPVSPALMNAETRGLPAEKSLHGTAAFFLRKPDTTRPGPWTTVVYVRGNAARPIELSIQFSNHASGGVRATWLNEKLLFLQVWRGRIASTDLVLDVEARRFVHREAANYGILILPCDRRPKK